MYFLQCTYQLWDIITLVEAYHHIGLSELRQQLAVWMVSLASCVFFKQMEHLNFKMQSCVAKVIKNDQHLL